MEFTLTTTLILIGAAAIASFIQRVSGFGFGIFIMTLLPYILPSYGESTALSGLLAMSQSAVVAWNARNNIVWKRVLPMLGIFCVFAFIAIQYVAIINRKGLMIGLGIILIALSIYFLFFSEKIKIKPSLPMQLGMGTISGLMGGFFGMQGPPAVLYFIESEPDKNHYIAQTQVYFLLGNLFMSFSRFGKGFVTATVGHAWVFAILGVCMGTYIGSKVFERLPAPTLRKIIYIYMAISGVVAIV